MLQSFNPSITYIINVRDNTATAFAKLDRNMDQATRATKRHAAASADLSREWRKGAQDGQVIASSVVRLGERFGVLNDKQADVAGTALDIVKVVLLLDRFWGKLGKTLGTVILLLAKAPVAAVAAAAAADLAFRGEKSLIARGVSKGLDIAGLERRPGGTPLIAQRVPGAGQVAGAAQTVINITGSFLGNDAEAQQWARRIGDLIRGQNRTRGTSF